LVGVELKAVPEMRIEGESPHTNMGKLDHRGIGVAEAYGVSVLAVALRKI
jgi:hypothetical protein